MKSSTTLQAVPQSAATRVEFVHRRVRRAIEHGALVPGQRLVESDLTREYGVSRGPLREALARLAVEGLVEIVPNRGAMVCRLGRREIADTMVVRQALEGLAAALAAGNIAQGDNRARLQQLLDESAFGHAIAAAEFLRENEALHMLLVEFANNPQLSVLIERLRLKAFPRRVAVGADDEAHRTSSSREHLAIAKAVLKGDVEAARLAMQAHLAHAQKRLLALMPEDD